MFTFLSYSNQTMIKFTGDHGHVICMGNLGRVFTHENTTEGRTKSHKSSYFSYKQVSERNGDHE